jgi:putative RNA 2'-phosphotransferase
MNNESERIALSKHLSYILRHHPESVGLTLPTDGWIEIDTLLNALNQSGRRATHGDLYNVVHHSSKQRFELQGDKIRAAQGHSIPVDLGVVAQAPPDVLFHGTVARFLTSISSEGLLRGKRTHVHLSSDVETAEAVASRRGEPMVLRVRAKAMHAMGYEFFLAANGVWLTTNVPADFLDLDTHEPKDMQA